MTESSIIYPGTFDPITNGHIDLIKRASTLFDQVIVAVAESAAKSPVFSTQERVDLVQASIGDMPGVRVQPFDCLLTELANQLNARIIMRGLRALSDFEFELQLATMNRRLKQDMETLFLTPDEQYAYISSSLVREIASYGGDISSFVPEPVADALKAKY